MSFFNSTTRFFKQRHLGAGVDPVRDWLLLLTVLAIALAGIIVWNIWAFDTVANGRSIGAPVPRTPPAFNASSLDTIRVIFTNRAAEEAKYETGVYRFADPSL
ncbi:MAG: hypothetical protein NUV60_00390 [Patescibacteria group bacterium]|nr:hypothetical protein [Patescibacteria group bacterium]